MTEFSSRSGRSTIAGDVRCVTPHKPGIDESPCSARWISGEPCRVDATGDHHCWRSGEHRTHVCDCGVIKLPTAKTPSACTHPWSEGRACRPGRVHWCQRGGDYGTHACACRATSSVVAA